MSLSMIWKSQYFTIMLLVDKSFPRRSVSTYDIPAFSFLVPPNSNHNVAYAIAQPYTASKSRSHRNFTSRDDLDDHSNDSNGWDANPNG